MDTITLDNLIMKFDQEILFKADNISLINNEIYCFIGKNGTGKSTFLRLLTGLLKQTEGTIKVFGEIMYQPQKPKLFNLSVIKNILIDLNKGQNYASACNMLKRLNIENLEHKKANILSIGQIQKIALIRSLLHKKDIVLLDEPLSSCDEHSIDEMVNLIKEKCQNSTIIVATHSIKIAKKLSNNAILIDHNNLFLTSTNNAIEKYCTSIITKLGIL